jgi:Protein of unknown function (DUF2877)
MTPERSHRSSIAILRSGILAQELCRQGAAATVEAVFERSLYLRSGDTFICIGAPEIGSGPLTLIADFGAARRLRDLGLRPRQTATASDLRITLADAVAFTLGRCSVWRPPDWPAAPPPGELAEIWPMLAPRAAAEAPDEGLARVVFGSLHGSSPPTPFRRAARARIEEFEAWLSGALANSIGAAALPEGLIGLGPGLTPSGDDFLLGALALLDALAERKAHGALAHAITSVSPALTSPLSHCFLRAAANGHVGEHLHRAVSSVISGRVDAAIATIREIGHSSGWDMLAGVATAMRMVSAARRDSADLAPFAADGTRVPHQKAQRAPV